MTANPIKLLLSALVACFVVTGFVSTAHACGSGWGGWTLPETDIELGDDEATGICAIYTGDDGTIITENLWTWDTDGEIDIEVDADSSLELALWGNTDTVLFLDGDEFEASSTENGVTFYSDVLTEGSHVLAIVSGGVTCGTIKVTTLPPSSVPEPATLVLLGTGLLGVAGLRRRRQKRRARRSNS